MLPWITRTSKPLALLAPEHRCKSNQEKDAEPKGPVIKTDMPGPKTKEFIEKLKKFQNVTNIELFGMYEKCMGNYFCDADQNVLLDLHMQLGTLALGYNYPDLMALVADPMNLRAIHTRPAFGTFPSGCCVKNIETIIQKVSPQLPNVVFFNCESGATENVMKAMMIAFQEVQRDGEKITGEELKSALRNQSPGAARLAIMTFRNADHGDTIAALSASSARACAKLDMPTFDWPVADFPSYRYPLAENVCYNEAQDKKSLEMVEDLIDKWDSRNMPVVGIIVEPIQSECTREASPEFFQKLQALTYKHGIFLVFDETKTGCGATGTFWGFENFCLNCPPDAITFARKTQVPGFFHSLALSPKDRCRLVDTWMGDPVKIHVFVTIINLIEKLNLLVNVRKTGQILKECMLELEFRYFDLIHSVRGLGTFLAFDAQCPRLRDDMLKRLRTKGILCGQCGKQGITLRPSLIFKDEHAHCFLDKLEEVIKETELMPEKKNGLGKKGQDKVCENIFEKHFKKKEGKKESAAKSANKVCEDKDKKAADSTKDKKSVCENLAEKQNKQKGDKCESVAKKADNVCGGKGKKAEDSAKDKKVVCENLVEKQYKQKGDKRESGAKKADNVCGNKDKKAGDATKDKKVVCENLVEKQYKQKGDKRESAAKPANKVCEDKTKKEQLDKKDKKIASTQTDVCSTKPKLTEGEKKSQGGEKSEEAKKSRKANICNPEKKDDKNKAKKDTSGDKSKASGICGSAAESKKSQSRIETKKNTDTCKKSEQTKSKTDVRGTSKSAKIVYKNSPPCLADKDKTTDESKKAETKTKRNDSCEKKEKKSSDKKTSCDSSKKEQKSNVCKEQPKKSQSLSNIDDICYGKSRADTTKLTTIVYKTAPPCSADGDKKTENKQKRTESSDRCKKEQKKDVCKDQAKKDQSKSKTDICGSKKTEAKTKREDSSDKKGSDKKSDICKKVESKTKKDDVCGGKSKSSEDKKKHDTCGSKSSGGTSKSGGSKIDYKGSPPCSLYDKKSETQKKSEGDDSKQTGNICGQKLSESGKAILDKPGSAKTGMINIIPDQLLSIIKRKCQNISEKELEVVEEILRRTSGKKKKTDQTSKTKKKPSVCSKPWAVKSFTHKKDAGSKKEDRCKKFESKNKKDRCGKKATSTSSISKSSSVSKCAPKEKKSVDASKSKSTGNISKSKSSTESKCTTASSTPKEKKSGDICKSKSTENVTKSKSSTESKCATASSTPKEKKSGDICKSKSTENVSKSKSSTESKCTTASSTPKEKKSGDICKSKSTENVSKSKSSTESKCATASSTPKENKSHNACESKSTGSISKSKGSKIKYSNSPPCLQADQLTQDIKTATPSSSSADTKRSLTTTSTSNEKKSSDCSSSKQATPSSSDSSLKSSSSTSKPIAVELPSICGDTKAASKGSKSSTDCSRSSKAGSGSKKGQITYNRMAPCPAPCINLGSKDGKDDKDCKKKKVEAKGDYDGCKKVIRKRDKLSDLCGTFKNKKNKKKPRKLCK